MSGPAHRYSAKPKWLLESYSALAKFQKTSEQVRESFDELQVSFGDFDDKAQAAKAMDVEHARRLREEIWTEKGPNAAERHALAGEEAERHRWVALPCEIHSEILLFLDTFDVDRLLRVGNQLRFALLSVDQIWRPWCEQRWGISGVDDNNNNNPAASSWLRTCATRALVLRPALHLCMQYKHYNNIHANVGSGHLQEWVVLFSGLIFLFSAQGDWRSRQMVRKRGGARFFVGLAKHDSHRVKTAALAVVANALACVNERERSQWVRNLKGNLAPKVFSSLLITPLSDVSSSASREAARALGNMSLTSTVLCYEHEVDACGDYSALPRRRGGRKTCVAEPELSAVFSWENAARWNIELCYQSGGLVAFAMDELVLNFTDLPADHPTCAAAKAHQRIFRAGGGMLLTGSCFDSEEKKEDGGYRMAGRTARAILTVRGCYRFSQTQPGLGECSFSVYQSSADGGGGAEVVGGDGVRNATENRVLNGMRALRNFRGHCTSQSKGWWGVWSNAGSSESKRTVGLVGGGVFQLRWKNSRPGAAQSKRSRK